MIEVMVKMKTDKYITTTLVESVNVIGFENLDRMKFGSEYSISGMIFSRGQDLYFMPFSDVNSSYMKLHMIESDKNDWDKLMFQLDNVETVVHAKDENDKLVKIVVRKSQRRLQEKIVWNVFRRDNYTCQYCGKDAVPLTVDHIIRWEKLGQTVEDNLITSCKRCNGTRGDMEFIDWLESDFFKKIHSGKITHLLIMNNKALNLPLREYRRKR